MKKLIKGILAKFGYQLKKIQPNRTLTGRRYTMQDALTRCAKRGITINTVIDVGASDGRWSSLCAHTFPDAQYLLVEAQQEHETKLTAYCDENAKASYVIAAAGPDDGMVYFDNADLFGGLASKEPIDSKNNHQVAAISLDNEIARRGLQPPYLLKLDTHGFEVPILEGSKAILQAASLVIIETYNYKLTDTSLRFYDLCKYMETLGFYPIEMVDFMLRPYDYSFWQMDTFFVKKTDKAFEHTSYK